MVISKEECETVRKAVEKLPDKYRIPVLLYYMEDLPQSDIASLMRISESAVKTRLHRAKRILKEKLEGML
jgi:RNA polymerase sigma-70 factor (ECF subfamily)